MLNSSMKSVQEDRIVKNVVHIPARSGSSRLREKNIATLGGHPLIAYTVRAALKMRGVDRVIVNTDSEKFAAIAREYGAETPFLRPSDISGDKASLACAAKFFSAKMREEGYEADREITLLPTSPFRNVATLNRLMDMLDVYFNVVTVYKVDHAIDHIHFFHEERVRSLVDFMQWRLNDAYVWVKPVSYFSGRHTNGNGNPLNHYRSNGYYFLRNPFELIDIDTEADLELAEDVVRNRMFDFGVDLWS